MVRKRPLSKLPSLPLYLTIGFLLMLSVGCAASKAGHPARTSPPGAGSAPAEAVPAGPGEAVSEAPARPQASPAYAHDGDPVVAILSKAQEEYDLGLEALKTGDADEARRRFDSALEVLTGSGIPLSESRRLEKAYERMVADIAALEWEMDEPIGSGTDAEPAPSEALDEITTDITPEEARRERETVGPEAASVSFDIPVVVNDAVLGWIDIFKNVGPFRKSFIGGYERYGWYEPMIHRIFKEEGMPADLIYMAFLESTYKTSAYSRARAKGIWQFMTPTGRQYGLRVDRYVDERSHPEKSTRAAARYMKDLYATFGDWHLAIAAYNTGAGNIMRAQRRSGKTDYWDLVKTRYLRRETKNFVPAILALALMAKDPAKYGFEGLVHNSPLEYDRVTVDGPARLEMVARLAGVDLEEVRFLNPHLRLGVTPPNAKGYELFLPLGSGERFAAAYTSLPENERIARLDAFHTVRRGETLGTIAARYGTSVSQLRAANRIRNPNRLSVGMQLVVPAIAGGGYVGSTVAQDLGDRPYHVVRRGDTLSGIATAYRVPLSRLLAWNDMHRGSILRPGMRIRVTAEGDTQVARSVERMETSSTGTGGVHTVKRGDTLASISRRYGVSLDDLFAWNGMNRRTVIHPGMKISVDASSATRGTVNVPGGGESSPDPAGHKITYRIRRGDNLFRIAMKYGTTVENLKAWNKIPDDRIQVGETLTIYPD